MEVPEDAVSEILLRLPVQSLSRFRCVCKNWYTQINSPLFKEKHIGYQVARRDIDDDRILVKMTHSWGWSHYDCVSYKDSVNCYADYESLIRRKSSYDHDMGPNRTNFSTLVHGIVCLFGINIHLFNPVLGELRTVPNIPYSFRRARRRAVGFGFDDATQEYMLVQIFSVPKKEERWLELNLDLTDHKCVVYLVKADSFTMIQMPAFISATYFNNDKGGVISCSFFSHGSIHWCVGRRTNYRILTFNVTTRSFQEIHFPYCWNDFKYNWDHHLLKVDNSCIALVAASFKGIDVWLMKEYGVRESWTKQYSINSFYMTKPLSFWRKDKLFFLIAKEIVCYDLSNAEVCGSTIPISSPDVHSLELVTFYESFVSFKQS